MKLIRQAAARLFTICKTGMIAASINCSRSLSPKFKTIRTLVLAILFAASVVATANAGLHAVSSPQIDGQLLATAVIADNDIWAVGFSDQVPAPPVVDSTLAEHFDGTRWSIVPTPPLPSGNAELLGVAGAASNDVWAVGLSPSGALVEHWDGTSWSLVSSPAFTGVSVAAISAHASNDVWVVGGNGSNAGVEHWDGTSWSLVSSPDPTHSPGLDSFLSGIAAISASDIWAVGFNFASLGSWDTLTEHWDGTSWKIIGSANPGTFKNALFGVSTLSDGTVAAAGFQQDEGFDAMALIMGK